MEPVSEIQSESGKDVANKKEDNVIKVAVASEQPECKVENIPLPTENMKEPASPPPPPAKVEVHIETESGHGVSSHAYTDALHAQLTSLEEAKQVENLPHFVIGVAKDDENSVEVLVIVSFADTTDTLIHSGNLILEAVNTTTLMDIKKEMSKVLNIPYEDMSIACGKRFLSDCRSLDYYAIFDGTTLHLLVDTPDEIFKNVFQAFLNLGHNEGTAALATRYFVSEMVEKYNLNEGDNPLLTEELLMIELGQFYVPDKYDSDLSDSDDTPDEDDSFDDNEYPPSVFHIGELEMIMMQEEQLIAANYQILHDNLIISDSLNNYDNEENSENDSENLHNENENTDGDNDSSAEEDSYDSDGQ